MKRIPDNIISIKVDKIKTPKEVWTGDKELLSLYPGGISIEETDYPTDAVLDSVIKKIEYKMRKRAKDEKKIAGVDCKSIEDILSWMVPEIEGVWKAKLKEKPVFKVLKNEEYLLQTNELEREVSQYFNGDHSANYISNAFFSPAHGLVLFPSRYTVYHNEEAGIESEWGIARFEDVLCEQLSRVLFRQVRGEWKINYTRTVEDGGDLRKRIARLNYVIAQYVKETVARKHPKWALYVISDKIGLVWLRGGEEMEDYICIDALAKKLSLHQIAMADDMAIQPDSIRVGFSPYHPYNSEKQRIFGEGIKS